MAIEREEAVADHWRRFGEWLKDRRLDARLNATEAAKRADIHLVSWSRLENGQAGTKRTTLPRILSALGIKKGDPEYLEGYRLAGFVVPLDASPIRVTLTPNSGVTATEAAVPLRNDPNDPTPRYEPIDYPAFEAFLRGLPPELQQEEYERVRRAWMEFQRGQTDYGKRPEEDS